MAGGALTRLGGVADGTVESLLGSAPRGGGHREMWR